jgi:hypothetical protein
MTSLTTRARAALEGITGDGDWQATGGRGSASVRSPSERCSTYLNVRTVEVDDCVARWQRDARTRLAAIRAAIGGDK